MITIDEHPTSEHLSLLLEQPAPGVLRLDIDTLDGPAHLGAGSGYVDVDALCDVTGTISCRRGGQGEGGALRIEVGTLNATLLDVAPDTVRPGQRVRLALKSDGDAPLFTGRVTALRVSEFRDDGGTWHTQTNFSAADAVADLASVTRYGAIVDDGQAVESIPDRLKRLITSAPPWLVIEDPSVDLWYLDLPAPQVQRALHWDGAASDETARWTATNGTVDTSPEGRPRFTLDQDGTASRTLTGLVPGRMYALTVQTIGTQLRYGVDNPQPTSSPESRTFIAQATTAVLTLRGPAAAVHLLALYLAEWDGPTYACTSTVYESSLTNHLHRTCATAPGLRWLVNAAGTVWWLSVNESWPTRHIFTDEVSTSLSGELHYVDIERGYSTADTIVDVRIDSAQRGFDEAGAPTAADRNYGYSDPDAASTWGGSATTRETFTASDLDARDLARRVLTGRPMLAPTSVRWNAAEDFSRLSGLEVADKVAVRRLGTTTTHTLAAITHEITASRHMVALDLIPLEEYH